MVDDQSLVIRNVLRFQTIFEHDRVKYRRLSKLTILNTMFAFGLSLVRDHPIILMHSYFVATEILVFGFSVSALYTCRTYNWQELLEPLGDNTSSSCCHCLVIKDDVSSGTVCRACFAGLSHIQKSLSEEQLIQIIHQVHIYRGRMILDKFSLCWKNLHNLFYLISQLFVSSVSNLYVHMYVRFVRLALHIPRLYVFCCWSRNVVKNVALAKLWEYFLMMFGILRVFDPGSLLWLVSYI